MRSKMLSFLFVLLMIFPRAVAARDVPYLGQDEVNQASEATTLSASNSLDDTLEDFVLLSWHDESKSMDCLTLLYVDSELDLELPVWDTAETEADYTNVLSQWAFSRLDYGVLHICKAYDSERLGFMYDGVNEVPDSSDSRYYTSLSLTYPGKTEGQLKATQTLSDQTTVAYANFYCEDGFNAIRIEWTANESGSGTWNVSKFNANSISTASDAEIAARFGYFEADENYIVNTGNDIINVRESPNGDIIGQLVNGSQIVRFDFEMMSETQGLPFTLIAKYTDSDADDTKRLIYYGWAASKFLPEHQYDDESASEQNLE